MIIIKIDYLKKILLDGLINYIFFVPIILILNTLTYFFGLPYWNLHNIIIFILTSFIISFTMGGIFGRLLNLWRNKLKYNFNYTKNVKLYKNLILDSIIVYIYFTPIAIILNTLTYFFGLPYWNLHNIIIFILTSFIINFALGGIFCKIVNIWRRKLNYY